MASMLTPIPAPAPAPAASANSAQVGQTFQHGAITIVAMPSLRALNPGLVRALDLVHSPCAGCHFDHMNLCKAEDGRPLNACDTAGLPDCVTHDVIYVRKR